jgi:hypothetical protein
MIPVEPVLQSAGDQRLVFDGPDYRPLPAVLDAEGHVTTEWALDALDLMALEIGGRIRIRLLTFGRPPSPMGVSIAVPSDGVVVES